MNFVNEIVLEMKAGKGGDGKTSFSTTLPKKGIPDGGNGGRGGNVYFKSNGNLNSLNHLVGKKIIAENGESGKNNSKFGKKGKDVIVELPKYTDVYLREMDKEIFLLSLDEKESNLLVAKGGKGGRGNKTYVSSINRSPKSSERGERGNEFILVLRSRPKSELVLMGFLSSGKTTFFNFLTNNNKKSLDYGLSDIKPNFGVFNNKKKIIDTPSVLIDKCGKIKELINLKNFIFNTKLLVFFMNYGSSFIEDVSKVKEYLLNDLKVKKNKVILALNNKYNSQYDYEILKKNILLLNKEKNNYFREIVIIPFFINEEKKYNYLKMMESTVINSCNRIRNNIMKKDVKEFGIYDFTHK